MSSISDSIPEKQCSICKEKLPATTEYFYKKSKSRDGLQNMCKKCAKEAFKRYYDENNDEMRERSRQYDHEHPEKAKARKKRAREENPDKIREQQKNYRKNNPEKIRQGKRKYRLKHPEKGREAVKRYRIKNPVRKKEDPEKIKSRNKRYRIENPDKVREIEKRYREEHPEKGRETNRRRAVENNAQGEYTEAEVLLLYELQQKRCCWCGQPMGNKFTDHHLSRYEKFTEDHIKPITREGSNFIYNIVLACWTCNSSRQNLLVFTEWRPPNMMEWMLEYVQIALQK
jgi:hypothetical protein